VVAPLEPGWELEPSNEIIAFRGRPEARTRGHPRRPPRAVDDRGLSASCNWTTSLPSPIPSMQHCGGSAPVRPHYPIGPPRRFGRADRRGQRRACSRRRRSEAGCPRPVNDVALFRDLLTAGASLSGQGVDSRGIGNGIRKDLCPIGHDPRRLGAGDRLHRQPRRGRGDEFGGILCLADGHRAPQAGRPRRSRSAFRNSRLEAGSRPGQRVVRGTGAAVAHRQPFHRTCNGQSHRQSARFGCRSLGYAAPRCRRGRYAASRTAP